MTTGDQEAHGLKMHLDDFAALLQKCRITYEPQGPLADEIDRVLAWNGYLIDTDIPQTSAPESCGPESYGN